MDNVIYRQDAIDTLTTECSWTFYDEHGQLTPNGEEILGTLKKIPSAQKKGHWVKAEGMMPPEYHGHYFCSECEEWAPRDWKKHKLMLSPFCPNCGADMRGE